MNFTSLVFPMNIGRKLVEKERIGSFLEVDIPTNISHVSIQSKVNGDLQKDLRFSSLNQDDIDLSDINNKTYKELSLEDIHDLYPERVPALRILKAVVINYSGENIIMARFTVTKEMCEGHMPGFPILPLAEAGRTLAQVGAILISYQVKKIERRTEQLTPLVYKVGELVSGQKGFLYPGDNILIVAKAKKLRGPIYTVEAHGYLGESHIFSMPQIQYFVTNENCFWNDHRNELKEPKSKSVFLIYWFRIKIEKIECFANWAKHTGMNFWGRQDGIKKYKTFRPSISIIDEDRIAGEKASIHGISQVEAESMSAINKILESREYSNIQKEFLAFLEPGSLQYTIMEYANTDDEK